MLTCTEHQVASSDACDSLHSSCLNKLEVASNTNRLGFRYSALLLLSVPAVKHEIYWMLHCAELNEAANKPCVYMHLNMSVYMHKFDRLMEPLLAKDKTFGCYILATIVISIESELHNLVPGISVNNSEPLLARSESGRERERRCRQLGESSQAVRLVTAWCGPGHGTIKPVPANIPTRLGAFGQPPPQHRSGPAPLGVGRPLVWLAMGTKYVRK